MIVSVASGKGGTGKTTVTASLAVTWPRSLMTVDLDVEEPNLHLFLKPEVTKTEVVNLEIPDVDESKCTFCRKCAELCQFKAIAVMGQTIMTFPEMCHGCGGCMAICPEGAIGTAERELGVMEIGTARGSIPCLTGRLRVGEAMSPPLMRVVRSHMPRQEHRRRSGCDHRRTSGRELSGHERRGRQRRHRSGDTSRRPLAFMTSSSPGKPSSPTASPWPRSSTGPDSATTGSTSSARNTDCPFWPRSPIAGTLPSTTPRALSWPNWDQDLADLFAGVGRKLTAMAKEVRHA